MTGIAELLDFVSKILGVAATVAVAVIGAKVWQWRSEQRKTNAEAASGEAQAGETMVATALALANPALVAAMGRRLTVLETWAEEEKDWQNHVLAQARANGWTLRPPPIFPRPGSEQTTTGGAV